jgi:ribosome maturation factor RimP
MIISTVESGPRKGPLFFFRRSPNRLETIVIERFMAGVSETDLQKRFYRENGMAARIAALAEPVVTDLGYRLVRVKVSGQSGSTLQIMVDRPERAITVDDCALVSRRLSPILDASDPMPGSFLLEISSPGIDRPLVRPSDFIDWTGFEAKIEMKELIAARRRFRGVIEGYEDGEARLQVKLKDFEEPQTIGLPVDLIADAKLVLTDELLKAAKEAQEAELAAAAGGTEQIRSEMHGAARD